jgi:hypothetical protein
MCYVNRTINTLRTSAPSETLGLPIQTVRSAFSIVWAKVAETIRRDPRSVAIALRSTPTHGILCYQGDATVSTGFAHFLHNRSAAIPRPNAVTWSSHQQNTGDTGIGAPIHEKGEQQAKEIRKIPRQRNSVVNLVALYGAKCFGRLFKPSDLPLRLLPLRFLLRRATPPSALYNRLT